MRLLRSHSAAKRFYRGASRVSSSRATSFEALDDQRRVKFRKTTKSYEMRCRKKSGALFAVIGPIAGLPKHKAKGLGTTGEALDVRDRDFL
jgi:hypothetical protein